VPFHLNFWDVVGILAYTQTVGLLESAMVLLVLILLGAILPARLFRDEFVAQGSMLVLLTLGWAIAARYTSGL
jgi:positive regulator of sigma E activity